jgi:hypothetical protein
MILKVKQALGLLDEEGKWDRTRGSILNFNIFPAAIYGKA